MHVQEITNLFDLLTHVTRILLDNWRILYYQPLFNDRERGRDSLLSKITLTEHYSISSVLCSEVKVVRLK